MNRGNLSRYTQTHEEIAAHLRNTLEGLRSSADGYDAGNQWEAPRLAAAMRILLHDNKKSSRSLLGQLGRKATASFISTSLEINDNQGLGQFALIVVSLVPGRSAAFKAPLDERASDRHLPFESWWEEVILRTSEGTGLRRKDLVLTMADQDGGAHVDPNIDDTYARLSRKNALGVLTKRRSTWEAVRAPVLVSVRQIAHEVLKTLVPGYTKLPPPTPTAVEIAGVRLGFSDTGRGSPP